MTKLVLDWQLAETCVSIPRCKGLLRTLRFHHCCHPIHNKFNPYKITHSYPLAVLYFLCYHVLSKHTETIHGNTTGYYWYLLLVLLGSP